MNLFKPRAVKRGPNLWLYCPGCQNAHRVTVEPTADKPTPWTFNGDLVKPTLSPSVKLSTKEGPDPHRCHFWLRDGCLEFCADSAHALAGQTVDLPEAPDWL